MDSKDFYDILDKLGASVIQKAKENLEKNGSISSGTLYESLTYEVRGDLDNLVLSFSAEDYADFVENGRRPGKYPPISAIQRWCQLKGIPQGAAFPIARKIFKFGITPKPFLKPAVDDSIDELVKLFADKYQESIPIELQKILDGVQN